MQKHFYMTSSCTPFMIYSKVAQANKTSDIILECKEKQNCCENIYFNLCLIFDLLHVIQKYFSFYNFSSVYRPVYAVIDSYRNLKYFHFFRHFHLNYNTIVCIFPLNIYKCKFYWILQR